MARRVLTPEDPRIQDLQGLVWDYCRPGRGNRSFKALALDSGLCEQTVSRIAYGETRRPHANTVWRLLDACGYRDAIVPASAPRQPDEIDPKVLRRFIPKRRGNKK